MLHAVSLILIWFMKDLQIANITKFHNIDCDTICVYLCLIEAAILDSIFFLDGSGYHSTPPCFPKFTFILSIEN